MIDHFERVTAGRIRVTENRPGHWLVTWLPDDATNPLYPGVTLDSDQVEMPTAEGLEGMLAWAKEHHPGRSP